MGECQRAARLYCSTCSGYIDKDAQRTLSRPLWEQQLGRETAVEASLFEYCLRMLLFELKR